MENEQNKEQRDEMLWMMARRRASFKAGLGAYIVVNLALVAIWYFSSGPGSYFWPVWPMIGWGIGVALQYVGAYHADKMFSTEEEYKKLKRKQENRY